MERTDDDYRLVITKIIELYNARYPALLGYQTDLAKWMIATLSLVNVGGLAALFHENRVPASAIRYSAPFFGIGVALALACGLLSWTNTNIAIAIYDDIINPTAIIDRASWKGDSSDPRHNRVRLLAKLAILSGLLSLFAAGGGCIAVWMYL